MNAERHHRHAIEPQPPRDHRNGYAQRKGDFRPEQPGSTKLHPSELRMAHVQLDRRFGERKVGWEKFDFLGLRHFTSKEIQQAEQRAKVDIIAEHDPFYLEEIGRVRRIHLIVTETTGDGKILSWHSGLSRQCMGRDGRPLTPQDQPARALRIEGIVPTS